MPEAITRWNVFLTMLGVEREHAAFQPKRFDRFGRGRDFVALFLHHQMAKYDPVRMAQSREHVRRLLIGEGVKTAAQRLAVDGDGRHAFGLSHNRRRMRPKRGFQRVRIGAMEDVAQARV